MKTDHQLQLDVLEELTWDPSVHAEDIAVHVVDGVTTITGSVPCLAEKWNAEHAAQRVAGVNALAVELRVRLEDASAGNDTEVAAAAQNALKWATSLQDSTVKVLVEDGHLTLSGEVSWNYQSVAAASAVRFVRGVTGVTNLIVIQPSLKIGAVKADIEAALKRAAVEDAGKIGVRIDGSEITLTGSIRNWAERNAVTNSAWATPGVTLVVDQMTMEY